MELSEARAGDIVPCSSILHRNSLHAFYQVGKTDGILALQKGLVPALWYQFFMNGFRLGSYQVAVNLGLTKDSSGKVSWAKSVLAGAVSGCMGAAVGSPFYMVKTHLQARASAAIAVGTQHSHASMTTAFRHIYTEHGVVGLWRGMSAAVARVMVGSAVQLSTFSTAKEYIEGFKAYLIFLGKTFRNIPSGPVLIAGLSVLVASNILGTFAETDTWTNKCQVLHQMFNKGSMMNALLASILSGFMVVACMTPFDVVSTRIYNQPVDSHGKGTMYRNVPDCFRKVFRKEGVWGFYKGWGPSFLRLCPHTVLSLVFWDQIRVFYSNYSLGIDKR